MSNAATLKTERERNDVAKTFPCPLPHCAAPPLQPCTFGLSATGHKLWSHSSHEARYNLAAAAGLVPRPPGRKAVGDG